MGLIDQIINDAKAMEAEANRTAQDEVAGWKGSEYHFTNFTNLIVLTLLDNDLSGSFTLPQTAPDLQVLASK